jgi:hypothetical protein
MHDVPGSHFKKHLFCPFRPTIKLKIYFYVASQKSLVTKIIGLGNMHISGKNGFNIQQFSMEVSKIMVAWYKPSELLLGGIFCEEFFYETLVCHV